MSTDMRGIFQSNIFSQAPTVSVAVPRTHRYRVLAESLPWADMAQIANKYRSQKVDINNGRSMDLRLHLGAYAAQAMNNWTDRETEDMVRCHGGVRFLCGVEGSDATLDHTSIEEFRNALGKDAAQELNRLGVQIAASFGLTGSEICSADTTVQEAPIEYPTEVGHLKKMAAKLAAIAAQMADGAAKKGAALAKEAAKIFKDIRLSVRGKTEAALKAKKALSLKLHETVGKLLDTVGDNFESLSQKAKAKAEEKLNLFNHMHEQIKMWLETGFHPKDKILSLWNLTSRAIPRGKIGKATEFGRRWIVTMLSGGYVIGSECFKLGADADVKIADEVLIEFLNTFAELPDTYVYDRGGNGRRTASFSMALESKTAPSATRAWNRCRRKPRNWAAAREPCRKPRSPISNTIDTDSTGLERGRRIRVPSRAIRRCAGSI